MLFKNKITDYDWLVIIDQRLTEVAYGASVNDKRSTEVTFLVNCAHP